MNSDLKDFKDPLLAELDDFRNGRERARRRETTVSSARVRPSTAAFLLGILILAAAAGLGYHLYQTQTSIQSLTSELSSSQGRLNEVAAELRESHTRIEELNEGLDGSRDQLASQGSELNRYRNMYQGLRSEQDQQTREIHALNVRKADQSEVVAVKQETGALRSQIGETEARVEAARTTIARLETRADEHQGELAQNRSEIAVVRAAAEWNTAEIDDVKRSLEREYYNFELQEGGGYMKVFEVALALRGTDAARRQFDLYILADGKVIRKRNHSVNEPILFYVEGRAKPFEVVVTRIDRKLVVGYLSVPKA
jgi:predicted  nucleic acid-binding Zn-ribbon protein